MWKKFPKYVPRAKRFSSLGLQFCLQNFVIMALLSLKDIYLLYRGGDNWPASCDIGALRVDQADMEADLVHISWRGGWSWVEGARWRGGGGQRWRVGGGVGTVQHCWACWGRRRWIGCGVGGQLCLGVQHRRGGGRGEGGGRWWAWGRGGRQHYGRGRLAEVGGGRPGWKISCNSFGSDGWVCRQKIRLTSETIKFEQNHCKSFDKKLPIYSRHFLSNLLRFLFAKKRITCNKAEVERYWSQ